MPIELDVLRGIRTLAVVIGTSAILLFILTVIINIITMFPKRVNHDKRKTRPWEPTAAVRIDDLPEEGQEIVNQGRPKRVKRYETNEANEGFVLDYNRNRETAQKYKGKGKAFADDEEIARRQLEPLSRLRPTPLALWSNNQRPPQHPPPGSSSGPPGPPGPDTGRARRGGASRFPRGPAGSSGRGTARGVTPAALGPVSGTGRGAMLPLSGWGRGITPAPPGPVSGTGRETMLPPPRPVTGTGRGTMPAPPGWGRGTTPAPPGPVSGTGRGTMLPPPRPVTGTGRGTTPAPPGWGRGTTPAPSGPVSGTGRGTMLPLPRPVTGTGRGTTPAPPGPVTGIGRGTTPAPPGPVTGIGRGTMFPPPRPVTGTGREAMLPPPEWERGTKPTSAPSGPGTGRGRGTIPAALEPVTGTGRGRGTIFAPPVTSGVTSSASTKPSKILPGERPSSIDFLLLYIVGETQWAMALAHQRQLDVDISAYEVLTTLRILNLPIFLEKFSRQFMKNPDFKGYLFGDTGHPHWFLKNLWREYYGDPILPYVKPPQEEFDRVRIERNTIKGREAIFERARKAMKNDEKFRQGLQPPASNTSLSVPPVVTTSVPVAPLPSTTTSASGIGSKTTLATDNASIAAALYGSFGPAPTTAATNIPGNTAIGRYPIQEQQGVADYITSLKTGLITGLLGQADVKNTTTTIGRHPIQDQQKVANHITNLVTGLTAGSSSQPDLKNTTTGLVTGSSSQPDVKTTTVPAAINPFIAAPRPKTNNPIVSIPATSITPGLGLVGATRDKIGELLHGLITPSSNTNAAAEVQKVFGPPNDLIVLPPTVKQNIPFHYVSDLHLEQTSYDNFDFKPRAPYLILAGDIGNTNTGSETKYRGFLARMCAKPELKRIFLVAGNRDFWPPSRNTMNGTLKMLRGFAKHPDTLGKLVFMENDRFVIEENGGKVVILGCTLWTEKRGIGGSEPSDQNNLQRTARHRASCDWIRRETKKIRDDPKEFGTRILIITHMPPSKSGTSAPEQTAKKLRDFSDGDSYGSDVIDGCKGHGYDHSSIRTTMPLLDWRDVWIWGHTHWNEPRHGRTRHGGMRFEYNQRGNARGNPKVYTPKPPGAFKPEKIILV
ncbi:hypothetical protein BOTCAL_0194g00080 [Botryotinia calthae]|uniref:Calcineurin-like phosphoesterase domain-containing protein n=1 Tax=Botryotinia calthae TaxID=38488 RepID=A0A4Y8CZM7_9HELO|nr:hypothetical protein BOTCAL_0194g00080 [Botryotinia calthae]